MSYKTFGNVTCQNVIAFPNGGKTEDVHLSIWTGVFLLGARRRKENEKNVKRY